MYISFPRGKGSNITMIVEKAEEAFKCHWIMERSFLLLLPKSKNEFLLAENFCSLRRAWYGLQMQYHWTTTAYSIKASSVGTVNPNKVFTLIMPNTASFQLVLKGFLHLFGFKSHIKSTPQMFPRWLRWLTHCKQKKQKKKKKREMSTNIKKLTIMASNLAYINMINLVSVKITVLMSSVVWWYKPLGP